MSRYRKELYPITIFHSSVSDNQKLKNLIIPYIQETRQQIKDSPEGWFTSNIITSFEKPNINSIFFDKGTISQEIQSQYMDVIKTFFDQEWEVDIDSMWYNYYEYGEYQEGHTHMGDFKSPIHFACIHFIAFDPKVHSPLVFSDPLSRLRSTSLEMNSSNYSEKHKMNVREGDFLMFPSYLEHEVKAGLPTPGNPRITISFNIKVLRYGNEK